MCFVPADQAVVIAGLDFKVLRILALFGLARIIITGDSTRYRANKIDNLVVIWAVVGAISFSLLWGTFQAVINRAGTIVDLLVIYYVFRVYVNSIDSIYRIGWSLVISIIVLTPFVTYEYIYAENPFSIFGRNAISFREGRIRCSGAFSHAILLGSFSASIAPIALGLYKTNAIKTRKLKYKLTSILGIICSIMVTIFSASSGPMIALISGLLLTTFYRFRFSFPLLLKLTILVLFILHLIMKKPVWHLIARVDFAGGSTGYHRYLLIDKAIIHFNEWALIGVKSVADWGIWAGDVTNMYILQGVQGGSITFLLFFLLIYRMLNIFWKYTLNMSNGYNRIMAWGIFCSTATHAVSFISVAYFGQIQMLLILLLATASLMHNISPPPKKEIKRPLKQTKPNRKDHLMK